MSMPLDRKSLLAYAMPSAGLSMLGFMLATYVPTFFQKVTGLSLATIGLVFMLMRLWDAVIDPVIGSYSDRTNSKYGRRKPWIFVGTPLLLVMLYLFCFPPANAGLLYVATTTFLFYIALTIVQIPYLSWGAELSRDYSERMRITGFREAATMVGVLLATSIPLLVLAGENPEIEDIVRVFGASILVLLPFGILVALTRAPNAARVEGVERPGLISSLKVVAKNKPFMRILAAMFFVWVGGGIYNALSFFVAVNGLSLQPASFLWFVFIQYAVGLLCLPLHIWIGKRIGKHRALLFVGLAYFVILPLFYLVEPGNFSQAMMVYVLKGAVTASIWVMPPALVADAVENGMLDGSGDDAGLYMSLYFFIQKAAMALGVGLAFPLAQLSGFNPQAAPGADVGGLLQVALLLSGLVVIPAIFLLFNYPIDEKRHGEIREELRQRGVSNV
ncbi:MAG: MFS transporter [Arenicella sp.]|nr:MFS transporter [Arenicella sp.]